MADIIPITEKKYFLAEKIDCTPEVLVLRFRPEDGQPQVFDPGMFMMISGIDKNTGQKYVGRAFSIASDPATPNMEFFVIKEPTHGEHLGRSHFMDAEIGDPFMLKGPNGQFRFDPSTDKKVMFIAGGTGLAPFVSMAKHIKLKNAGTDAILLYSVKFPTEIIFKDQLEELSNQIGMKFVVTVTRLNQAAPQEGSAWTGETGRVDSSMIGRHCSDVLERTFYICGPLAFVQAVKQALTSLKVPDNRIKADVWG